VSYSPPWVYGNVVELPVQQARISEEGTTAEHKILLAMPKLFVQAAALLV
jgi:hypothetical protein